MKKKIIIIGQFPPPIHGLSVALQTIIQSKTINNRYSLKKIDIKENRKFINHLFSIIVQEGDLYYFTISQTILGNIRDMIILAVILLKKKRVLVHFHGGYYKLLYNKMNWFQKVINQVLISKIDLMIALSESLKKLFIDVIDKDKVIICENFIADNSLCTDEEFTNKTDSIDKKTVLNILYLSNFIKSKGYKDVLKSAKILRDMPVSFHFAGAFFDKNDKNEFFKFIEENELTDLVTYHGVVSGEKKKSLLMTSDVFTLPTYYENEGQPISIIEAMGNGLTIIATRHAGIPDVVTEENGFLVNKMAPSEISYCIKYLLANKAKLVTFAENNRKIVLLKYREEHYLKRLYKIFEEVLNE